MAGSLSIPNTLNTLSGTQPLSLIDTNFTTIASYVNTREITVGAVGSRPAAGVSGRYYFATDVNAGTLFVDTGAAWQVIAWAAPPMMYVFAWGATDTGPPAGTTNFMGGGMVNGGSEANLQVPMAYGCTISNLFVATSTAPTAGQTFTYTVRKNGVDTAVTCQVAGAATSASDTVNSVTFAQADKLTLKVVTSGAAAVSSHNAAVRLVPT